MAAPPTASTEKAKPEDGQVTVDGKDLKTLRITRDNDKIPITKTIEPHIITGRYARPVNLRYPSMHNYIEKDVPTLLKYTKYEKFYPENQIIPLGIFEPWFEMLTTQEMVRDKLKNEAALKGSIAGGLYNDALFNYLAAMERDAAYARASNRWLKKEGWRYKFINQGVASMMLHINGVGTADSFAAFDDAPTYKDNTNNDLPSETENTTSVSEQNPPDEVEILVGELPEE